MTSTPSAQTIHVSPSKSNRAGANGQLGVCRAALLSILPGAAILAVGPFRADATEVRLLASPDDRIQISIQMPEPGSTDRPCWSASFQGKPLLTNCRLGLQTTDAGGPPRRCSRSARIQ